MPFSIKMNMSKFSISLVQILGWYGFDFNSEKKVKEHVIRSIETRTLLRVNIDYINIKLAPGSRRKMLYFTPDSYKLCCFIFDKYTASDDLHRYIFLGEEYVGLPDDVKQIFGSTHKKNLTINGGLIRKNKQNYICIDDLEQVAECLPYERWIEMRRSKHNIREIKAHLSEPIIISEDDEKYLHPRVAALYINTIIDTNIYKDAQKWILANDIYSEEPIQPSSEVVEDESDSDESSDDKSSDDESSDDESEEASDDESDDDEDASNDVSTIPTISKIEEEPLINSAKVNSKSDTDISNEVLTISKPSLNQIFKFNDKSVRIFGTWDRPSFVGKDIAEILEYEETRKAIQVHVDIDDKMTVLEYFNKRNKAPPFKIHPQTMVINEAGLYSLIFSSKLPKAKEFKKYVFTELMPLLKSNSHYNNDQIAKVDTPIIVKIEDQPLQQELTMEIINFQGQEIRVVGTYEKPCFIAKDVAKILGYRDARDMLRILNEAEKKGTHEMRTLGGVQKFSIITESGLYHAIFKSIKPIAEEFRFKVTNEILPSIRKKGYYITPQKQQQIADLTDGELQLMMEKQVLPLNLHRINNAKDIQNAIQNTKENIYKYYDLNCNYIGFIGEIDNYKPSDKDKIEHSECFKFGETSDIRERLKCFRSEYGDRFSFLKVWHSDRNNKVETDFAHKMKELDLYRKAIINGKIKDELFVSRPEYPINKIFDIMEEIVNSYKIDYKKDNIELGYKLEISELKRENQEIVCTLNGEIKTLKFKLVLCQNGIPIPEDI